MIESKGKKLMAKIQTFKSFLSKVFNETKIWVFLILVFVVAVDAVVAGFADVVVFVLVLVVVVLALTVVTILFDCYILV